MKPKPTLAIDFDGTIALCREYPFVAEPVKGAVAALRYFNSLNIKFFIWTCRGSQGGADKLAAQFLNERGIKSSGFNTNRNQRTWTDSPKMSCTHYIDDRALGCPILRQNGVDVVDWDKVMRELTRLHPNIFSMADYREFVDREEAA